MSQEDMSGLTGHIGDAGLVGWHAVLSTLLYAGRGIIMYGLSCRMYREC